MKNLNTIISIVILVAIVVLVGIFTGKGSDSEEIVSIESNSSIIIENDAHDFGDIDIFGGKVSNDYVLINTGNEDVIVTSATTSCGCTEGEIEGESFGMHFGMNNDVVIPANSSITMTGIFDPLAHGPDAVGPITRILLLQTNSLMTPELEVRISANVTKN